MRLNNGTDFLFAQAFGNSPGTTPAQIIVLSTNSTAPAVTDNTFVSPINTAGGGLVPAAGTYAHTAATNTATLTKTFTMNSTDGASVTVNKMYLTTLANLSGVPMWENLVPNPPTLVPGDSVTLTETLTFT